jgi:cellulose synthase/poly-beta-1,6-N-acetylglucosamine synthase-like glycosyltransferase
VSLLLADGVVTQDDAHAAEAIARRQGLRVADVLSTNYGIAALTIAQAYATLYQTQLINPCLLPPTPALLDKFGAARAISTGLLPLRMMGDTTVVLTDKPDQFDRQLQELNTALGPVRIAITTRDYLERSVLEHRQYTLSHAAETKVPLHQSSRQWDAPRALKRGLTFLILLCASLIAFPTIMIGVLCAITVTVLLLSTALKAAAAYQCLRTRNEVRPPHAVPARLPTITLLIPLFRETEIAQHLVARLRDIDYPIELLDVCLVTESDDLTTRDALGKTILPTWMRPIVVPQGTLRTKPRALNFALDFARGSIIGVYDAEDAPAPDQLRVVAAHFANSGPEVACLQGVLDYYNDSVNWLTRCFTIEYASWFRVVLPGLEQLGLVVHLGGTTLFFRRNILESLGGWDAHNVTEDADLGVRLARAGYRTELIPTVTQEEANGRFWPWIKQRSRWLKGYAITYAVHMRAPKQLWADLGARRFWGGQLLFAGTLSQFVLAPVLWSFWLIPLGVAHPLLSLLSPVWFWVLAGVFFATEIINLAVAAIALRAAKKTWLIRWAITLQVYFPMAAIAAYKGLIELAWKPYYWDKTTHGVLLTDTPIQPQARPTSDA